MEFGFGFTFHGDKCTVTKYTHLRLIFERPVLVACRSPQEIVLGHSQNKLKCEWPARFLFRPHALVHDSDALPPSVTSTALLGKRVAAAAPLPTQPSPPNSPELREFDHEPRVGTPRKRLRASHRGMCQRKMLGPNIPSSSTELDISSGSDLSDGGDQPAPDLPGSLPAVTSGTAQTLPPGVDMAHSSLVVGELFRRGCVQQE